MEIMPITIWAIKWLFDQRNELVKWGQYQNPAGIIIWPSMFSVYGVPEPGLSQSTDAQRSLRCP